MLAFLCLLLLLLGGNAVHALAEGGGGVIHGKVEFGDLPTASLSVRLDGGRQYALVRRDGSFTFRQVPAGVHEIAVADQFRVFSKALVSVTEDKFTINKIIEITPPTQANAPANKRQLSQLVLRPLGLVDYFEKRQQMTLASIFQNPMMVMMLITLGLGMLMPKMMEGIDPEELKAAQDQIAGRKPAAAAAVPAARKIKA